MGLAATIASRACSRLSPRRIPDKALMHGPTFMANPLPAPPPTLRWTCSRASRGWRRSPHIEPRCARSRTLPGASRRQDVRVMGAIGVVELEA